MSQITVECTCGGRFGAPESLAGEVVACPTCGRSLTVAATAQQSSPPDSVPVTCACGVEVMALASMRGKSVRCPSCSWSIKIPHGSPSSQSTVRQPRQQTAPQRRASHPATTSTPPQPITAGPISVGTVQVAGRVYEVSKLEDVARSAKIEDASRRADANDFTSSMWILVGIGGLITMGIGGLIFGLSMMPARPKPIELVDDTIVPDSPPDTSPDLDPEIPTDTPSRTRGPSTFKKLDEIASSSTQSKDFVDTGFLSPEAVFEAYRDSMAKGNFQQAFYAFPAERRGDLLLALLAEAKRIVESDTRIVSRLHTHGVDARELNEAASLDDLKTIARRIKDPRAFFVDYQTSRTTVHRNRYAGPISVLALITNEVTPSFEEAQIASFKSREAAPVMVIGNVLKSDDGALAQVGFKSNTEPAWVTMSLVQIGRGWFLKPARARL